MRLLKNKCKNKHYSSAYTELGHTQSDRIDLRPLYGFLGYNEVKAVRYRGKQTENISFCDTQTI